MTTAKPSFEQLTRILEEGTEESDAELALRLGGSPEFVGRVRACLGMEPRPLPSLHAKLTPEERVVLFSEEIPGGHRRWLGTVSETGLPVIGKVSVRAIAFRIEHGREPEGRVRRACGQPLCVTGSHLSDQDMRTRGVEPTFTRGGRRVNEESRRRVTRFLETADEVPATVAIAAQLGVDRRIVAEVRSGLGIGRTLPERQQPKVWTREALEALMTALPGGHCRWEGRVTGDGVPVLDNRTTAARAVFAMTYGRDPEGVVRVTCERKHCVAGAHLADRPMREGEALEVPQDAVGGAR